MMIIALRFYFPEILYAVALGVLVVNLINFDYRRTILISSLLVGLGFCLFILAAIFSGRFPYYGETRIYYLILSAGLTACFTVGFIVNLIRAVSVPEKALFCLLFGMIMLVSIAEYYYLIQKQDDLIFSVIPIIENDVRSYELLSEISDNEAIAILSDPTLPKNICGISYFLSFFYLCTNQPHRNVVFMIDITPAPGLKRAIRVSVQDRKAQ